MMRSRLASWLRTLAAAIPEAKEPTLTQILRKAALRAFPSAMVVAALVVHFTSRETQQTIANYVWIALMVLLALGAVGVTVYLVGSRRRWKKHSGRIPQ